MSKSTTLDKTFVASALLDPISQLLGLGSFDQATEEIKNRIRNLATQAYSKWKEKEQGVFGGGLTQQVTNMPNRYDLEKVLYNDMANETYAMEKKIAEAAIKDKASGRNNAFLNFGGDVANQLVNVASNIGNLFGIKGSDKLYNLVQDKQSKWANKHLHEAEQQAQLMKNEQSRKVAEFNKQIAASHNQNLNAIRNRRKSNVK